ncbi:MAG TPA: DUF748 domain-containing protein, partial [Methylomirabilota bacterium]|nr:DUF748 domain-containing protein [Methylomirabilota bacterium]
MGRPRTWIIVVSVLVAVVAIALAVLPVGVRLLAERRAEALTGREVTIGDVDLNLFTRRLVATEVRVHGRDGEPAPLTLARLSTRFRIPPLLRGRWHLERLALAGLDVYLQRTAPDRFNVSDVVAHIAARPEGEPVEAVVEALLVTGSRARLDDRAVEPERRWTLGEVALEAHDIVTVGDAAEGRASATFVLAGAPGTLEVRRLGLRPLRARATATVDGLGVADLAAYVPTDAPVRPAGGRVTTEVTVDYDADGAVRASGAAS